MDRFMGKSQRPAPVSALGRLLTYSNFHLFRTPTAYSIFESACALSSALFFIGGILGLVVCWLSLSIMPAIVSYIEASSSIRLFTLIAFNIVGSVCLVSMARSIALRAFHALETSLGEKASMKEGRTWFNGSGIILAWASCLMPFYVAVLLSINPWMSVAAAGMVYASMRGFMGGMDFLKAYRALKKMLPDIVPVAVEPCKVWPFILGALFLPPLSLVTFHELNRSISATDSILYSRTEKLTEQLRIHENNLPVIESLYRERIGTETLLLDEERKSLSRGITTQAAYLSAQLRVIASKTEAAQAIAAINSAIAKIKQEISISEEKRIALRSALPLHR